MYFTPNTERKQLVVTDDVTVGGRAILYKFLFDRHDLFDFYS